MSLTTLSEEVLRNNTPFELFKIGRKSIKVSLLGSAAAEEWAQGAREVFNLDIKIEEALGSINPDDSLGDKTLKIQEIQSLQKDRAQRIRACLFEYDGTVFSPEVLDSATAFQIESAFNLLRKYNDPFVSANTYRSQLAIEIQQNMKAS